MNDNVFVNDVAELAVVKLVSTIFSDVAYMEPSTVRHNVELACEGGMSREDRSIRAELANYLMSHFSLLYIGLIINKEFRDTFVEAVSVEIALDDKDEEFVNNIRKDMQDGRPKTSKGNYVINLSSYNEKVYQKLNGKLAESFDKVIQFNDAITEIAADLTDEECSEIGFVASNFMYLIRAFAKNPLFTNYAKSVLHTVQEQLDIKL